jgi:hypothetical protein
LSIPTSECRQYFGYLSERSREVEIPEDCITCPKSLGCMLQKMRAPKKMDEEIGKWHSEGPRLARYEAFSQRQPLPPLESLLLIAFG